MSICGISINTVTVRNTHGEEKVRRIKNSTSFNIIIISVGKQDKPESCLKLEKLKKKLANVGR